MCFWNKKQPVINDGKVRKALLIGINTYEGCPLAGCRNDAIHIKALLIEKYGFTESDIIILLDDQATTDAILAGIDWLSTGLKAEDIVCFWYSGHGAQVPNSGEADGLSECICPIDFDWSREHMIIDKDFVRAFSKIPPGVIFNWGSDSCHSGDLDRGIFDNLDRPTGFFKRIYRKFFGSPLIKRTKTIRPPLYLASKLRELKKHATAKSMTNSILDVGFISGCRSNQTSADTEVNGTPCGALTESFLRMVVQYPDLSLGELCRKINEDLRSNGYDQQPCSEGTMVDKPWLSS